MYGLRQYRHLLLGHQFTLRTDHAALTYLLRTPDPVGQSARYLDKLAEFQFKVVHRPGLQHANADALSCRPCDRDPDALPCRQCKYDMSALEVAEDAQTDDEAVQALWQDTDTSFLSGDGTTAELMDVETVGSQVRGYRDSPPAAAPPRTMNSLC